MAIKRIITLVFIFSGTLFLLLFFQAFKPAMAGIDPQAGADTWLFQGRVYFGELGDESQTQPGVRIAIFGSQEIYPDQGVLIRETTTNEDGWYGIEVYDDDGPFSTYHVQAYAPSAATFTAVSSPGGTVRETNWIEFSAPLTGQTLSGNKFWLKHDADMPINDIPQPIVRRAAHLLETVRGTLGAPGWEEAWLYPEARPLFRPDLAEPAYFEFRVRVDNEPAGFIILATNDHDFPIAHWDFSGQSPTEILLRKAGDEGRDAVKFYKLDALDYAAESAGGEQVTYLGSPPVKVMDIDPAWLDQEPPQTDVSWTPDSPLPDDSTPSITGTMEITGPEKELYQLGGWESWSALKAGYGDAYSVLLEDLRREAAADWETENLAEQFGEGLVRGQTIWIPLLCEKAQAILEGPGVELVEREQTTRGGAPVLRLTVLDSHPGAEIPLEVIINCPQGREEVLLYWIVEEVATTFFPIVSAQNGRLATQGMQNVHATQGYQIAWVWMDYREQNYYHQLSFYPPPGISSCPSGCGATAWTMLFGWADNQADSLHWSYWRPRWGIYRQNGGYGANARAPFYMDAGIKNVTWEVKDHIDTWCAFGSAPTFPSDMDEAYDYLKGRTGTKLSTHYNVFGVRESRLRRYAANSIMYRSTPAVIGTGWLKHYPLAYGYQWWSRKVKKCFIWCWTTTQYNRQFWVNQGWGGSGNGWISASTWFAGEIYP